MIDIHPPHHGAMTRRDILTHLAIVVVGILIAVGTEQTVEYFHHREQRHQLEDDLRTEAERNQQTALHNITVCDKNIAWLIQLQQGIDKVRDNGGKADFVYPPRPDGAADAPYAYNLLGNVAWTTAKESSAVSLLPALIARRYSGVYFQLDLVESTRASARELGIEQGTFETRFSRGTYPPVFDIKRLSAAQLDEYEAILAAELEAIRVNRVRLRVFTVTNDFVLSGISDVEAFRQAYLKATTP